MSWNRLLFLIVLAAVFAAPAWASLNVKTCAPAPAISTIAYQDLLNCQISQAGESRLARFSAVAGEAITIGMVRQAVVSFAGLVPGFTGLYQLNVTIPPGVTGDAVPVVITQAAQSSPPVTIAVN